MSWNLTPHTMRTIMIKKNASVLIMLLCMAIPLLAAEDDGCGNGGGDAEPCTTNTDCPVGFICDTSVNECAETCTGDSDCLSDEECLPAQGGGGNLCYVKEDVVDPVECNDAATDCPADGQEYICDAEKKCEAIVDPGSIYQYVVIEDVSTLTCGGSDPGSDIYFVRVLGSSNEVLGYGDVSVSELGDGDDNAYISPGTINGEAPSFRAGGDECPDAFSGSGIYAMGCGGTMLVNFLDDSGVAIDLDNTMTIEVGEYGASCDTSPDDDPEDEYVVKLCTDTTEAGSGVTTSCTSILGSASGNSGLGSISVATP